MVKSVARQQIAGRASLARRQVAGRFGQANLQEPYSFPPGSYSFTPPRPGYWRFVAWGSGFGCSTNGGSSAALAVITRVLNPAQSVAIVVGAASNAGAGTDTTITFPDGKVVTAGAATGQNGSGAGVASGGDVNLPGNVGASVNGANAPSYLAYLGGLGGVATNGPGGAPGAGGCQAGAAGNGLVLAVFLRE